MYWDKEKHIYPKAIVKALEYLKNMDLTTIENGTYEIEGQEIYAKIFETQTACSEERIPETHGEFIDIQYLIEGKEIIGFVRNSGEQQVSENLLETKDNIFYESHLIDEIQLIMTPGTFAVFFPNDIHRPACSSGENLKIRKAVVKVDFGLIQLE